MFLCLKCLQTVFWSLSPFRILYWFIVLAIFDLINYIVYIRRHKDALGEPLAASQLAFVIIGTLSIAIGAAPILIRAHRYPATYEAYIKNLLRALVIVFVFDTTPMFILLSTTLNRGGRRNVMNMICFTLQVSTFVVLGIIFWFTYLYWVSERVHLLGGWAHRARVAQHANVTRDGNLFPADEFEPPKLDPKKAAKKGIPAII